MGATAGKVEFVSYSTWSSFMISKVSNFPFVALHNAMHFGQPIIHYDKYIADFAMQFEIDSLKYLAFRSRIAYFVSKISFVKSLTVSPSFYIIFVCLSFTPLIDGGKGTIILNVCEQLGQKCKISGVPSDSNPDMYIVPMKQKQGCQCFSVLQVGIFCICNRGPLDQLFQTHHSPLHLYLQAVDCVLCTSGD